MKLETKFDLGQRVRLVKPEHIRTFKKNSGRDDGTIINIWIDEDGLTYRVEADEYEGGVCSCPFKEEELEAVLV